MAYVYRHIRLDTNQPFYIGIGSDEKYKRANEKRRRNIYWKRIIEKTPYEVEILFDNISWDEACKKEIEFIALYGRFSIGGTLCNLTDGGQGNLGLIFSDEHKDKIRIWNKGRKHTQESISKMVEIKKGKKHTYEHKKKISNALKGKGNKEIICLNTMIHYKSISQAAIELGIIRTNIFKVLNGKRNHVGGYKFSYA